MSGTRLHSVRLPSVIASQAVDEEAPGDSPVVVDLPPSSKFGFAWPTDPPPPVGVPLATERSTGVSLSSSEGETDMSEEEPSRPTRRSTRTGESDESDFVTPTNLMDSDQNPLDQSDHLRPVPRLSRAFSMPLPSQLGSLMNPRRTAYSPSNDNTSSAIQLPAELGHFHELSLELADSVQMIIQTLLQLSPPQVLDPAKEQFSACSLSIPTPSVSAMFTSMKNLNYMSAHMSVLSLDLPLQKPVNHRGHSPTPVVENDFDVGEMLQSVGDVLSGLAAQADVDIVLFHGDLGMKHVALRGDESGISYTLSHVVRQIIATAQAGDTIEIGLFIEPALAAGDEPGVANSDPVTRSSSPAHDYDGPLRCTFHITHRFASSDASGAELVDGDRGFTSSPISALRPEPSLKTLFLRRLLRHVGASLETDVPPRGLSSGRPCNLHITLDRGLPSVVDPTVSISPDDGAYAGNPEVKISQEPTLDQLSQFAESLKGRKVTLFAHSKGAFAQHLTSYLTAWGMDVSHVSTEPNADSSTESVEGSSDTTTTSGETLPYDQTTGPSAGASTSAEAVSFCIIDDDVSILRAKLQKIRAAYAYPLTLSSRKRPSLAANHRPRSSPQVARVMGLTPFAAPPAPPPVVVHFTSLSNFKLVKDAVQSILAPGFSNSSRMPEVIVIPKPAGPRRVLTALHTAITRPVVDPFFYPTATSPVSPGLTPFFGLSNAARSPGARSTTSVRSDKSAKSPKDYAPSSPRGVADSMEYFSDAAAKLGATPASGLVIQSPDGQPAGIYFHPKAKGQRSNVPTPQPDHPGRARGSSFRRASDHETKSGGLTVSPVESMRRSSRPPASPSAEGSPEAGLVELPPAKGKGRQAAPNDGITPLPPSESPISAGMTESPTGESSGSGLPRTASRKHGHVESIHKQQNSDPPTSPSRATAGRRFRRPHLESQASAPAGTQKRGEASGAGIVPPISVLIVDDNPINQTILSTFMKKKKIKFDVAKNGEEAVTKWQTGSFHLILMDIQMPVMDGIEATKEIRRVEKMNAMGGFPTTPQSEGQQTPSEASVGDSRSSTTSTPPYRSSVIIVALTASSLQSDRVAALAAGCNDFLTKPVSLHWLNSKIIEWGSIKALQMWADIRPEVVKSISTGQAVQAQHVARRLHVPEGRTPTDSRSRASGR
ncbi:uncharacterized protein FIBRA_05496 [Fibroporia radiculosa]|uniref:Response regulatory domain-containing protein n=1 Tax=Fibroporia radiculosa TaxID=599839 RepID=J4IAR4_9APHY|nr:uncharacterized protein FIBRA_05496 [Fibroporia radiculosa]CCM03366.1 predicted protein [Fibroporia radiculosa]